METSQGRRKSLSWLLHFPMNQKGRYRDTRFWRSRIPRFLLHSMQTHVIHHLYPGIPHWDEPAAMEKLKPYLLANGVPGAEKIPDVLRGKLLL
ncbi:MAG: fatty acid desaturase [Pseudomonadales bacterium]